MAIRSLVVGLLDRMVAGMVSTTAGRRWRFFANFRYRADFLISGLVHLSQARQADDRRVCVLYNADKFSGRAGLSGHAERDGLIFQIALAARHCLPSDLEHVVDALRTIRRSLMWVTLNVWIRWPAYIREIRSWLISSY